MEKENLQMVYCDHKMEMEMNYDYNLHCYCYYYYYYYCPTSHTIMQV